MHVQWCTEISWMVKCGPGHLQPPLQCFAPGYIIRDTWMLWLFDPNTWSAHSFYYDIISLWCRAINIRQWPWGYVISPCSCALIMSIAVVCITTRGTMFPLKCCVAWRTYYCWWNGSLSSAAIFLSLPNKYRRRSFSFIFFTSQPTNSTQVGYNTYVCN